ASEDELTRLEAIALMQRQLREQDERPGSVFETLAFIEDNAATLVAATVAMISHHATNDV
ncbi:MAG: hypothetical protein MJE77_15240, partial [Proteobacteria bacterium]|nr:hypothetical protein [Pseudomonadota bacterium]